MNKTNQSIWVAFEKKSFKKRFSLLTCQYFRLPLNWYTLNTTNCRVQHHLCHHLEHNSCEMIEHIRYILVLCPHHSIASRIYHVASEISQEKITISSVLGKRSWPMEIYYFDGEITYNTNNKYTSFHLFLVFRYFHTFFCFKYYFFFNCFCRCAYLTSMVVMILVMKYVFAKAGN